MKKKLKEKKPIENSYLHGETRKLKALEKEFNILLLEHDKSVKYQTG
jgi:hypothetical protein